MEMEQYCWLVDETSERESRLKGELEELGWESERLSSPFSTCRLQGRRSCRVAVARLEGLCDEKLRQLEALILASRFPWIAVAPKAAMEDPRLSRFIGAVFHGFVNTSDPVSELDCLMRHAVSLSVLQHQEARLLEDGATISAAAAEYEMVGTSPLMHHLFKTIRKVAAVEAPVLISGESGTGKELTAQAIHERSLRACGAFHAINCGALPDHLIQSELFGHEKGAFTGAAQRKIGRIEATNGGTLFLDEIGDLPLELQVNLLRFLETRTIQRVGGLEDIAVDVRIIAATHVDLEKAVAEGRFREDLYHRLNVLQVRVPALREHAEDIEVLARYFFERFSSEKSTSLKGFSREALLVMRNYRWPGNIRELINRIRRAMVMCEKRLIQPHDLGLEQRKGLRHVMTLEEAKENAERDALVAALARNKQKVSSAAQELGVSRVTIYRLMEKHGLSRLSPDSETPEKEAMSP